MRLAGGVPLAGIWDEREIVQVLANLLLEAARASRPGTPVSVTLAASPRPTRDAPSGRARVLVQVHGSDVPRRGMARFFCGYRSRSPREAGGLQVSRRLAEAAGGRLSVTRRGGASYVLELPLAPPSSSGN